jgi:hypothetical protein
MTVPAITRKEVRHRLDAFPVLAQFFDACMERFAAMPDVAVAVSGSLSKGSLDRYSDLDFELGIPPGLEVGAMKEWVSREISALGTRLAFFPADHLRLDDLLVFFFDVGGTIVKVDIWVMPAQALAGLPGAKVIHDPRGILASRIAPGAVPESDSHYFSDLVNKFTGWMWFTCVKIARGEMMEADSSLDTMRSFALMPCLQLVEDLPREGYRCIEHRLAPRRLEQLRLTFPHGLDRQSLCGALLEMSRLFVSLQPEVANRLGREHRTADFDRMSEIVQRWIMETDA